MTSIIESVSSKSIVDGVDLMSALNIDREELDGLTLLFAESRSNAPITMTYDNICVHEFATDVKTNPRPTFSAVLDFAHEKIGKAVESLEKDSVKTRGDDWTIKNRFMTMDICLHCYTTYDEGDFVFEDVATHRVDISVVAKFDAKYIYQSEECNANVFATINQFYSQLAQSITEM
jgi:hypothetical protein